MSKNASLLVNSGSSTSQVISLNAQKTIKIKIQPGSKYVLKNEDDNFAPENITLQRNGDNLNVILEGDSTPAIVIEDYYATGNDQTLLGMAEDGQLYAYMVTDGSAEGYQFADGGLAPAALGGSSLGDGSYLFTNTETNDDNNLMALWPWFLGAAVAGIAGAAIYNNNKHHGKDSPAPAAAPVIEPTPAPEPKIAAAPTLSGAIDMTGNITGPISYGSSTDEKTPVLYGTGEAGSTVTIYDNGNAIGTAAVDADGKWSFKPTTELNEGNHKITVTQTNAEGSTSKPSDDFSFIVDTTAPTRPLFGDIIDNVGPVTGPIANGATTDDARPEVTGTGEPGNTVTIFINGLEAGKALIDDNGHWSWTPETDLADGHYRLFIIETDKAGNISPLSPTFDFNVDTSVPVIVDGDTTPPAKPAVPDALDNTGDKTGSIQPGDKTDETQPEFSGEGEPGDTIIIKDGDEIIGSVVIPEDGQWNWTPEEPLAEGEHSITIIEKDEAGNESEPSDPIEFIVDTTAPATPATPAITDNVGDKTGPINNGDKTDDNQPEFNGKGEAGDVISIIDNGEVIGTAIVDDNGNWSWTPEAPLAEGEHSITIVETDEAGNASQPSAPVAFEVDTTAPGTVTDLTITDNVGAVTGALKDGDITDDATPTFSGKAEADSIVTVYDGETAIGSVKADADGSWSFTPDALNDGDHAFSTTVTDAAGNTGDASAVVHITIDTSAVAVTLTKLVDNVGTITGDIKANDVTDDARPEVIGKGKADSTVSVYDGETLLGSTTVDAEGNWSFTPVADLSEGEHSITATATDKAGNVSEPTSAFIFTVDTLAPAMPTIESAEDNVGTVTGPMSSGSHTDDATPTLSGKAEKDSTVSVYDGETLLGTTIANSNGQWTFTTEALAEGEHSFHVTATDKAGNLSEKSADFALIMDFTAPSTPTAPAITDNVGDKTGPINNGDKTDDTQPEFNGKGEAGDVIAIIDNGTVIGSTVVDDNGNWSWTPEAPLAEGEHSITIVETDEAGNSSQPSAPVAFEVDTTAPATPAAPAITDNVGDKTGPINNGDKTDDTQPEFNGKGEAGDVIAIIDNGEVIGTAIVDDNGNWSWTPEAPLAEGEHSITLVETDEAGNSSQPSAPIAFEVDTTAPGTVTDLTITDNVGAVTGALKDGDITDDATPTFSGKAEADSIVTVYDGETAIGSVKADADGSWSFTPDALNDGDHAFSTTVTDAAGNTGDASAVVHITIDTSAVAVTLTKLVDNVGTITGDIKANDVTDDARPEVIGKGKADSTVSVYDGETLLGSTTVDAEGNWSFTPAADLSEGEHSITATATDKAGNVSEPTSAFIFTVDTLAPTMPTIESAEDNVGTVTGPMSSGSHTDDATPTLSGKAEKDSTVSVYDGETLLGTTIADGNGQWTFTTEALAESEHSFHVTATDKAGNLSEKSADFVLTMDFSAPGTVTDLTITDNVGAVTGALKDGDTTDDSTPTFSGKAEADSIVTVYDGETAIGSVKADADGSWSFTPDALNDGDHAFSTTVTDAAGNTGDASAAVHITIDTSTVSVSITKLVDNVGTITGDIKANDITDDARPEVIGKGKADSIINLYDGETLLGSTTTDAQGNWSFTPAADLSEGEHSITATATDKTGNVSEPTSAFIFTVDTLAPTMPTIESAEDNVGIITGPMSSGSHTDDAPQP